MTRCYLPPPLQPQVQMTVPSATAQHLVRVLRLRVGAELTVFDGRGGEYPAEILSIGRDQVRIALGAHQPIERESWARIILLQSLARGERMDLIVQKATELGAQVIVPVASQHSVIKLSGGAASRRVQHWRQVAISACEQCGRNRLPTITEVLDFAPACGGIEKPARRYLLDTEAPQSLATALGRDLTESHPVGTEAEAGGTHRACEVALLIGPEGGWSEEELALARSCEFQPVRLGPRVLRTETAPLAALAVVQTICGDLR